MTCKDCLHYEVCNALDKNGQCPIAGASYCGFYCEKSDWVHLPCKVGDRVFSIVIIGGKYTIVADRVHRVIVANEEMYIVTNWYLDGGEFNSNIFLTQEEAEKSLAERRRE